MKTHMLKIWPKQFEEVSRGAKKFEFRVDDRKPRFRAGDTLWLQEVDPKTKHYTGWQVNRVVTSISRGPSFGIPKGFVVMSLALAGEVKNG